MYHFVYRETYIQNLYCWPLSTPISNSAERGSNSNCGSKPNTALSPVFKVCLHLFHHIHHLAVCASQKGSLLAHPSVSTVVVLAVRTGGS